MNRWIWMSTASLLFLVGCSANGSLKGADASVPVSSPVSDVSVSDPTIESSTSIADDTLKQLDRRQIASLFSRMTPDLKGMVCALQTDSDWSTMTREAKLTVEFDQLSEAEIIDEFKTLCDNFADETSATQPSEPMDKATVVWWIANTDLQATACDVGYSVIKMTVEGPIDERTFDRLCAGENPDFGSQSGDAFTAEEVRSILERPAIAWLAEPSGSTWDALAAAALEIEESDRPVPRLSNLGEDEVLAKILQLQTYPGSDQLLVQQLDDLRELLPGIPPIFGDGTYRVGSDLQPGRYRAGPVGSCYWETLDEEGNINDNNFVSDAFQVVATVRSRDFSVQFDGCGYFVMIP